ncbi:hypothetical protein EVAR_55121_1 [Eumeta japonica]|uniref:Uncharacterized protein n=1 Tax=Eumeta variegata TaxID=151549 RepID=A0A4C1YAG5_EUMVA|nr:hypothetical protein EVAR_55121_1 [Eumeta japonica]
MNSALKPVLSQAGVPSSGGQASPAKGNVAGVNHAAAHPQGAQNSLHHASNSLVVQNLTHHAPSAPQIPAHAIPSMAPITANMAQMAQNMSHHGNLSHISQNSLASTNVAVTPNKAVGAPLSLVQDKVVSQPLALTRTPDKKDGDQAASHANGTIDTPKSGSSAISTLKPQNPEQNKDKQDIARTSPSTPKPPEKVPSSPGTPLKNDALGSALGQVGGPSQPKLATANEPPEKSPSKPNESKPTPTADVAPTQTDNKPVPESANDSQSQEKSAVHKQEPNVEPKTDSSVKLDENVETEKKELEKSKTENVAEILVENKSEKEVPNKEESKLEQQDKVEEKKHVETPKAIKTEMKLTPKSTMKLATVTTPIRKRRQTSPNKSTDGSSPAKKVADGDASNSDARSKRNRTKVQLYQSPTPELTMATKLSASAGRSTPTKPNDDKLIVFYKNEYLAVRNAEGGFYVCQTMQNVYRSTRKIKIRWLSQDKVADPSGATYKPDFYDVTDMECVLTTLSMSRGAGGAQVLRAGEAARAQSILERALHAEKGETVTLTEEHPDGLDLSLYKDESQLEKKMRKRNSSKSTPRNKRSSVASPAAAASAVST